MGRSDYNQRRRRLTTKLSCGPLLGSCPSGDFTVTCCYLPGPYAVNTQAHMFFHTTGFSMLVCGYSDGLRHHHHNYRQGNMIFSSKIKKEEEEGVSDHQVLYMFLLAIQLIRKENSRKESCKQYFGLPSQSF